MSDTGITGALTDGTGISTFTGSKVFKDFVVDVLLSGAVALSAVGIGAIPTTAGQASVAAIAIGGAVIRALYRAVLKWGQTE